MTSDEKYCIPLLSHTALCYVIFCELPLCSVSLILGMLFFSMALLNFLVQNSTVVAFLHYQVPY